MIGILLIMLWIALFMWSIAKPMPTKAIIQPSNVFVVSVLALQQASFEKQQKRRKEVEEFITRFKAKASKAKQAQSRVKELARMEDIAPAPYRLTVSTLVLPRAKKPTVHWPILVRVIWVMTAKRF